MTVKLKLKSEFDDKGIKKAKSGVGDLGKYATGVFGKIAGAFAGIFAVTKVVGFIKSSVMAFMEAEKANKRLEQALISNGESTDAYLGRLNAVAKALSVIARVDDDLVIQTMALASNMGVAADNLDEVSAAAIAFNKAFGIDTEAAVKAVTLAMNGNTAQIGKYIPSLKGITDGTEAFNAITAMTVKLLREQSALSGTNAEKMQAIVVAWDQLKETFGGFLLQSGGVSMMFDTILLTLEDIQRSGFERWIEDTFPVIDQWADKLGKVGAAIDFISNIGTKQYDPIGDLLRGKVDRSVDGTSYAGNPTTPKQDRLASLRAARSASLATNLEMLRSTLGVGGLSKPGLPNAPAGAVAGLPQSRSLSIGDLFDVASGQISKQDPVVSELKNQTKILEEIRDDGVGGLVED